MERLDGSAANNQNFIKGQIYWCRVVSFDPSTNPTIAFSEGRPFKVQVLAGYLSRQLPISQIVGAQTPNQSPGNPLASPFSGPIPILPTLGAGGNIQPWERIDLTGTVSIEYSQDPFEPYPGPPGPTFVAAGDAIGLAGLQPVIVELWNGATFDRWREANADALAVTGIAADAVEIWNGATFDRWKEATADALPVAGIPIVNLGLFNGATFDRLRSSPGGDAFSSTGALFAIAAVFNGSTYDRIREGNASTLANESSLGSVLAVGPGNWTQTNSPAANTQATTSRAAVAATRHIATGVTASFAAGATAGAAIQINLRDGASGVGTILWSCILTAPIGNSQSVFLSGLEIVGSVNTAMTLEFAAAGGATTLESVTLTGYDAT